MRHSDPEGLYRALGITPTADQDEIKNAYRRLAKETHPDTAAADTSVFRFQKVYSAYKILSDSRARARYDRRFTLQDSNYSWLDIEPVHCSRCGKATAQPRMLSFERVYSPILASFQKSRSGIFCARCAQTEAVNSSLLTATFGWWSLPFAPFYTVRAIIRNALGGKRHLREEERLLWQNSRAFASRGKRKLGYALAKKLVNAEDREVAEGAAEFVEDMEARGANPRKVKLKDPWRMRAFAALTHLSIAAAVPLGIGGMMLSSLQPADERQETRALVGGTAQAPVAALNLALPEARIRLAPLCWKVPENGEVLYRINPRVTPGHGLELINSTPHHAIVKVRSAFSKRLITAVYMAANASAELQGIPDGYYVVQYAFGDQLASGCVSFVSTDGAWQFPDTQNLRSISDGGQPQHLNYSLSVAPAKSTASIVTADAFNMD